MTKTLKQFKGLCRGVEHNYRLISTNTTYIIESYQGGDITGRIESFKNPQTLKGIKLEGINISQMLTACRQLEISN